MLQRHALDVSRQSVLHDWQQQRRDDNSWLALEALSLINTSHRAVVKPLSSYAPVAPAYPRVDLSLTSSTRAFFSPSSSNASWDSDQLWALSILYYYPNSRRATSLSALSSSPTPFMNNPSPTKMLYEPEKTQHYSNAMMSHLLGITTMRKVSPGASFCCAFWNDSGVA